MSNRFWVLLFPLCPTGDHPGAVAGSRNRHGVRSLLWPLVYSCGCEDPRDRSRHHDIGGEG